MLARLVLTLGYHHQEPPVSITPRTPFVQALAAALVAWEQAYATPEQQAAWRSSSEPYNAILWASPFEQAYALLTLEQQAAFWEVVDELYTC